ncbi:MAG: hypothetical protein HY959_08640 [Ignavibacteriae bacterium]|nr:hypothetical protein [Ignavibacteriota bacterium]
MNYLKDYYFLKKIYNYKSEIIKPAESDFSILNFIFYSEFNNRFPEKLECIRLANKNKKIIRKIAVEKGISCPESECIFDFPDSDVQQNKVFIYPVYKNNKKAKSDSVIFLLHGLNEKSWDKYHVWAKALLEMTGKAVLMFPISFHINRVLPSWNHPRRMDNLSKERMMMYPDLSESSFVNAAISTRLQFKPETFFWSGMRTYNDIIKLINQIKSGNHPAIKNNASIDFFSYSIGAFLTEILLMDNHNNWFDKSKALLFCGGPAMSHMYPSSRYIYDSETYKSMTDFYVLNFDKEIMKSKSMRNYFSGLEPAALDFKSLLNVDIESEYREKKLKNLSGQIKAISLAKDNVIPPSSVKLTLCGKNKDIPVNVVEKDFPFEYDHISPFPLGEGIKDDVNKSFIEVFEESSEFLG